MINPILIFTFAIIIGIIIGTYLKQSIVLFLSIFLDFLTIAIILKIYFNKNIQDNPNINFKILKKQIKDVKRYIKIYINKINDFFKNKVYAIATICLLIFGIAYPKIAEQYYSSLFSKLSTLEKIYMEVIDIADENKYICKIYDSQSNIYDTSKKSTLKKTYAKAILTTKNSLNCGDIVEVSDNLKQYQEQRNEHGSDIRKYYYSFNIIGYVNSSSVKTISSKTKTSLIFTIKQQILNLANNLQDNQKQIFKSLVLGISITDDDLKQSISNMQISHLFSISGMHLSLVFIAISYILNLLKKEISFVKRKYASEQKKQNITDKNKIYQKYKLKQIIKFALKTIFIAIYLVLLMQKISILRASIMLVLTIFANTIDKQKDIINCICISVVANILISPFRIFQSSFILSYIAIISIYSNSKFIDLIFLNIKNKKSQKQYQKQKAKKLKIAKENIKLKQTYDVKKALEKIKKQEQRKNKVDTLKNKFYKNIFSIIKIYIIVNVYTFILSLYFFNYFSVLSFFSNLIFSPFITFLYLVNNFFAVLNFIFKSPIISTYLNIEKISSIVLNNINILATKMLNLFRNINGKIYISNIQINTVIKYIVVIKIIKLITIAKQSLYKYNKKIIYQYDKKPMLNQRSKKDKQIFEKINKNYFLEKIETICNLISFQIHKKVKFKKTKIVTIKLCSILCIFLFINFSTQDLLKQAIMYNICTLDMIDVGQGDCTLIRYKGKNILIDGGGSKTYDIGTNTLLPFLLKNNVYYIDYIFISHMDSDHCLGLFPVISNLNVKNILIGKQFETAENLTTLYETVERNNKTNNIFSTKINIYELKQGQNLNIKDMKINILWPGEKGVGDINNNSLTFKIEVKGKKILFVGDIEKTAEEKMLNLDLSCDILKVAHHGSKTSSCQEFLNKANPKICLIGVGQNNSFGHPSDEVIKRLEKLGCQILRTDNMGQISLYLTKNNIYTKTLI